MGFKEGSARTCEGDKTRQSNWAKRRRGGNAEAEDWQESKEKTGRERQLTSYKTIRCKPLSIVNGYLPRSRAYPPISSGVVPISDDCAMPLREKNWYGAIITSNPW